METGGTGGDRRWLRLTDRARYDNCNTVLSPDSFSKNKLEFSTTPTRIKRGESKRKEERKKAGVEKRHLLPASEV